MTEQQKKIAAGSAFAVFGAWILYSQLISSGGTPAPPAAAVVTTVTVPSATSGTGLGTSSSRGNASGTKHAGLTAAELDPTLHMGPMLVTESLVYSGSGRNIFSGQSEVVAMPKPVASARPAQMAQVAAYTGPVGPPPPPPIDLKFFGIATAGRGTRQAFLLRGEDVFLASAGDVVQRRYKIVSIAANSMVVEDMMNNNRQTLPLLVN